MPFLTLAGDYPGDYVEIEVLVKGVPRQGGCPPQFGMNPPMPNMRVVGFEIKSCESKRHIGGDYSVNHYSVKLNVFSSCCVNVRKDGDGRFSPSAGDNDLSSTGGMHHYPLPCLPAHRPILKL